jgi:gliding motility-associated-like protein
MSANSLTKRVYLITALALISFLSKAQLVANFSATPVSGCAPLIVNFSDQSTGSPTTWNWVIKNAAGVTLLTSPLPNPSSTFFDPGLYSVTLTITNAAGQTANIVKTNYISVFNVPTVNFTATPPLSGCIPFTVSFTDNSTPGDGTITAWHWDFGDGNSDNIPNPSHTYLSAGPKNVTLTITNSSGCSKTLTKPNYINVSAIPVVQFTNSLPVGCSSPQTISFQNQSTGTGALTYLWNFGDGSATSTLENPTHTYTSGTYDVTLTVTNAAGCTKTVTHVGAVVIGSAIAEFTYPTTACVGQAISFINTSTPSPTAAFWTFGDSGPNSSSTQLNPIKTYDAPGTYTIHLLSAFGNCSDDVTHTITILAKPKALFTGSPLASCKAPLTVNFTSTSTDAVSYEWHFGDGGTSSLPNPSHTYTTAGFYTDTLIVTSANGCTDRLILQDYVKIQLPSAVINGLPKEGCAPLTVPFSATINSVVPITGYEWFANGVLFSTLPNPVHVFPLGLYEIKLVITTVGGCTDTVIVPNAVRATVKPTANFIGSPRVVCAFKPVFFTDLSTGDIDYWHWDFEDGTDDSQNPEHAFADTGYFTITLVVGNHGCFDTLRLVDYIRVRPPISAFKVDTNCVEKYKRTFTDNSVGADTYLWNFGDGAGAGSTSTIPNPVHTYAAVGTYTVSLTVHNNETGCDHTTTATITIADETAMFGATATQLCRNTATIFTATSPHTPPAISSYQWDFGDLSGIQTGNPITHTYITAGTYNVKLQITDVNGCIDTRTEPAFAKVYGPTANFTPSVPGTCLLNNITFNDLSTPDAIHPITEWTWNFGDGTGDQVLTAPFTHAYANPSVYGVTLKVKDSYGCTDTKSSPSIITISVPVAQFSTPNTPSCPNAPIYFTSISTGPGLTYLWEFGDTQTSTDQNPVHSYAGDGLYTVRLTVTDIYGCTDVEEKVTYIKILTPVANFTVNDFTTCPPLNSAFVNTSVNALSYLWNFGLSEGTSILENPSHTYNVAGTYTASLTVTGAGGCVSTKTQDIVVRGPRGSFTYAPINGCSPLAVSFIGTSPDNVTFTWDFNDGNVPPASTIPTITHPYTVFGKYVPKMILTDASGCTVPIVGIDTIRVKGAQAIFTPDTLVRCNSGNVKFTNSSSSNDIITGYLWNFGDGPTSTSTDFEPTHTYTSEGIYYPTLTVFTQAGCTDDSTYRLPVKIVKTPEISITQSPNSCVPATLNFQGNLLNADTAAINWKWKFTNVATSVSTTATGQIITNMIFPSAGLYRDTLIATNSSGCIDTSYSNLEVYPKPIITASEDKTICKGTGQVISGFGGTTYEWLPTTGLSCANCASPIATPDSITNYVVTGTSSFGCKNTDTVKVGVIYPFTMAPGTDAAFCTGKSKVLTAAGAYSYVWSPADGLNTTTGPTVVASPANNTNQVLEKIYTVTGSDNKNCFTDKAYYKVKVHPFPKVTAGSDKTINIGQSVTLTPTVSPDVTSVLWSPNTWVVSSSSPSITVKPNLDQKYKVEVANAGGCKAESFVNVFVLCDNANVFIPNTFSPNGDGMNERFYPRGTGLFTIKSMKVFNRWGEVVFEKFNFQANDEKAAWDGTFKGQMLQPDVYVYLMVIQCENNTTLDYKGNVALIK